MYIIFTRLPPRGLARSWVCAPTPTGHIHIAFILFTQFPAGLASIRLVWHSPHWLCSLGSRGGRRRASPPSPCGLQPRQGLHAPLAGSCVSPFSADSVARNALLQPRPHGTAMFTQALPFIPREVPHDPPPAIIPPLVFKDWILVFLRNHTVSREHSREVLCHPSAPTPGFSREFPHQLQTYSLLSLNFSCDKMRIALHQVASYDVRKLRENKVFSPGHWALTTAGD